MLKEIAKAQQEFISRRPKAATHIYMTSDAFLQLVKESERIGDMVYGMKIKILDPMPVNARDKQFFVTA